MCQLTYMYPHCRHVSQPPFNIPALDTCWLTYMYPHCKRVSQPPFHISVLNTCRPTYMYPHCKHVSQPPFNIAVLNACQPTYMITPWGYMHALIVPADRLGIYSCSNCASQHTPLVNISWP